MILYLGMVAMQEDTVWSQHSRASQCCILSNILSVIVIIIIIIIIIMIIIIT